MVVVGVSEVVRAKFLSAHYFPNSSDLGRIAHKAIFQYYHLIESIRAAELELKYSMKQYEWAKSLSIIQNFRNLPGPDAEEVRGWVDAYLSDHLLRLKALGKSLAKGASDYVFPLSVERSFCLRTELNVEADPVWLIGKPDLLWLDPEQDGVVVDELKVTRWNGRFRRESHELQTRLYHYLLLHAAGIKPAKSVRLSYLSGLERVHLLIEDANLEDMRQSILKVASSKLRRV